MEILENYSKLLNKLFKMWLYVAEKNWTKQIFIAKAAAFFFQEWQIPMTSVPSTLILTVKSSNRSTGRLVLSGLRIISHSAPLSLGLLTSILSRSTFLHSLQISNWFFFETNQLQIVFLKRLSRNLFRIQLLNQFTFAPFAPKYLFTFITFTWKFTS